MNGIHHVESKNIQGVSLMKLYFHPGTDMAQAMAETVGYVNRSRAFMPPPCNPSSCASIPAASRWVIWCCPAKRGDQTAPLGRAVVGGLAASTVATLLILPAAFALVMGQSSTASESLDPFDPESRHHVAETERG